jgi:hypothetical protein
MIVNKISIFLPDVVPSRLTFPTLNISGYPGSILSKKILDGSLTTSGENI